MATLTITATVELGSTPPRVKLVVADTGSPEITDVTVTRLHPYTGVTSTVRTYDGEALHLLLEGAGREATLYDYEVPYGVEVTYSTVEYPDVTATATVNESRVWLVDPGVPELSMPVTVAEFGDRTRPTARGVFRPLGRRNAVTVSDGQRGSAEGVLTLRAHSDSERSAIDSLIDNAGTLLLNVPVSIGWGIDACYVSFGDSTEARLIEYAAEPSRYFALPYVVTDAPVGGSQSQRTWADVIAEYPTWADLLAAQPTWAHVLAPTD